MSRQTKNGRCSCWDDVDKKLVETGDGLSESFTFSGHYYLRVGTQKLGGAKGKPKTVVATYCPFCGKKLKEPAV